MHVSIDFYTISELQYTSFRLVRSNSLNFLKWNRTPKELKYYHCWKEVKTFALLNKSDRFSLILKWDLLKKEKNKKFFSLKVNLSPKRNKNLLFIFKKKKGANIFTIFQQWQFHSTEVRFDSKRNLDRIIPIRFEMRDTYRVSLL